MDGGSRTLAMMPRPEGWPTLGVRAPHVLPEVGAEVSPTGRRPRHVSRGGIGGGTTRRQVSSPISGVCSRALASRSTEQADLQHPTCSREGYRAFTYI